MLTLPLDLTASVLFPVRLVQITRTDSTVLRLAEADEDIKVGGDTYLSLPGCSISAIQHALGGAVPSMKIDFAHSVGGVIDTPTVNKGFFDGAKVLAYIADRGNLSAGKGLMFTGMVQQVSYDDVGGGSFEIKGQAAEDESIIQIYGPMCRTDLFSSLCTVNSASYAQHGTVATIIDKFNCTISGLASPPDEWFNLGVGVTDAGIAFEIANWVLSTTTLTTFLPRCALFNAGDGVTLYPGCDKTIATCKNKFNNNLNFQGEPHFAGAAAASV